MTALFACLTHMKGMHSISFILVIVGALNWGLVGLAMLYAQATGGLAMNWNLVNLIFGGWPMIEAIVYALVGLAAVLLAVSHRRDCRHCDVRGEAAAM